ncbi:MAG TPA: TPM domain-containing protein [Firmicutes bacterium]|jgi:uncharacterized membrane protein|nr:TPM domain-containing protein [Bacillota bacterium]HOQ24482.1 TPM domain-containing protein [Bacillota bacterium]HPT67303.1 TPM domain-containing protein [Bacillota bacterium]
MGFFTAAEIAKIVQAIKQAESRTSGEIRVHVENRAGDDVFDRAEEIFERLKMHQVKERNGVLIYLAVKDRKFVILGDSGIDRVVPKDFWAEIRDTMAGMFRKRQFVEGICTGIGLAGEALAHYFPHRRDDAAELPREIQEE